VASPAPPSPVLDVDLTLPAGEFSLDVAFQSEGRITTLFGPSGAGKTLTLRCLAGVATPLTGWLRVAGRTLFDASARIHLPPRERRLGYVVQRFPLFPHLDVAGNVGFGLRGPARDREVRIAELLDRVGLPGFERRRPGELSGGEAQRVALARALAPDPELLLLDEPFSALDVRVRRQLRGEVRRLADTLRIPVLLVTHDPAEMRELSDHLVLIDHGRVLRSGPAAEVLAEPGSEDARDLLGLG